MSQHDFYYEFSGTPSEIGLAHGDALGPVIRSAFSRWKDFLEEMSRLSFDELLAGFLEQTNYKPAIEKWAPHLLEEMRGIAQGAQMEEEHIYVWQMIDEMIDYIIEYVYVEKCTTLSWSTECLLPCRRGNLLDDACIGLHLHSADCSRWPPDEQLPQMPEWTEKPWLRSSPQINDW